MVNNIIAVVIAVIGSSGIWGLIQHILDVKVRKRQDTINYLKERLSKVLTKEDIDDIKHDMTEIRTDIRFLKDITSHTKDLSLSSARNTLNILSNKYISLGYIPEDEYVAYKSIGKSYIESGGNTEIKTRYELVMRTLSVKPHNQINIKKG